MTETTAVDDQARWWIDHVVAGSPVARTLGVEVVEVAVDRVRLRIGFAEELTTVPGVLHGGVVASLIDIAGAASSASALTPDDGATGGATSHLTITYLAPATGDLEAVATVVHRTRSSSQSEVVVRGTGGELVATGQVSSRIFH